jgi:hypothetical protein
LLCQQAPNEAVTQSGEKARVANRSSKATSDRLLPGEDPKTIRPADAAHWIGIYAEMIGFKRQVLERVVLGLDGVSREARTELSEDVDLIEAQMHRYERRLEFWSTRAGVLTAADGSDV